MKIKRTVIITGYECNNQCRFCTNLNKRNLPNKTTGQILKEMIEARKRKTTYIEIIGGEQTIRPDIITLIRAAKKLGFRTIAMSTNGRRFSDFEFARQMLKAGINHLIFSIHGHNAKLHDSLTCAQGSFQELVKGVKNIKKLGIDKLGSNTTVVKQNYKFLPEIGEFIYSLGIRIAEFIFVDPNYGGAHDNFKGLVPRISRVAPYFRRCLEFGRKQRVKYWRARYVPLCYFEGFENQISETNERRRFHTEHIAPDFTNFDVENSRKEIARIKPDKCLPCKKYNSCEGIWTEYYRHYGDKELMPVI